jgi:hypothetical protein
MAFGSKRLLEPRRANTPLDRAGVAATVERVCEELNAELRRKAESSWMARKLGYDPIKAEQTHLRYLCDTSGEVIRVFLNARSGDDPPKWDATIRTSPLNGETVVELQLLSIDTSAKFAFAEFSDAFREALR